MKKEIEKGNTKKSRILLTTIRKRTQKFRIRIKKHKNIFLEENGKKFTHKLSMFILNCLNPQML